MSANNTYTSFVNTTQKEEPKTTVINGHLYILNGDMTKAQPVAFGPDDAKAAKTNPDHYLNKTLDIDPKTLKPVESKEEKPGLTRDDVAGSKLNSHDRLKSLLHKMDAEETLQQENTGLQHP